MSSSKVKNGALLKEDFKAGQLPGAGAQGQAGSQGPKGDQGSKGDKGDVGPSGVQEAFDDSPPFVILTGTNSATANPVVTLPDVAPGSYQVTAVVGIARRGDSSSRVLCETSLGGTTATAIASVGNSAGFQSQTMIPTVLTVTTASTGAAQTKCWTEGLTGLAPFAGNARIAVLKVGSATSTSVNG